MSTLRTGSWLAAASAVLFSLVALAAPVAMAAEGTRVLDPQLSLIGGCLAEELDTVEDPGCPTTPPAGDHPPTFLDFPRAVTTDLYGNIYVANWGKNDIENGTDGRIDIFSSAGRYISSIPKGVVPGPMAVAVDSVGTLYVWLYGDKFVEHGQAKLLRFEPCLPYDPAAGEIEYCEPPTAVTLVGPECPELFRCRDRSGFAVAQLAINPQNDHLFLERSPEVVEYGSAAEENEEIRSMTTSGQGGGTGVGIAVDAARQRLYAQSGGPSIEIYNLAEGLPPQEPYEKIGVIEASAAPNGQLGGALWLAVDEGTGSLYVYDSENSKVLEFDEDGKYVETIESPLQAYYGTGLAVDNGPFSPNGALSEIAGKGRYLFVPSHPKTSPGHLFAFFVSTKSAPKVESIGAVNVGEEEAKLRATINPGNLATTYAFEIKAEGAAGWTPVGGGSIPAGNLDVEVSASARGLAPGTRYQLRVLASNEKGPDEAEASFATYPSLAAEPTPCPNAPLRGGVEALLPDCRAYELVTPPNTAGHAPRGLQNYAGGPSTRQASPAGDRVGFRIEGGSLPGFNATGALYGDNYTATRSATGWSTSLAGLTGEETIGGLPGTGSPDQGHFFSQASGAGPAVVGGKFTTYVTYPDGHSELLGRGSLGVFPEAVGRLISEGAGHIIFSTGATASSPVKLEPGAAPSGTGAIYDRTADGSVHVVSLKPGDLPFGAGEDAKYKGASPDGRGVAFEVGGALYLRHDDAQTLEVADGVEFAGLAEGGGRVFYLEGGNLKALDASNPTAPIMFANAAAEVVPVTISADGSTAYFLTESAIPGSGANPQGAKPKAGGQNLYRSKEGAIAFLGTVTERDVAGVTESGPGLGDGLGLWLEGLAGSNVGLGMVPARSTPDGGAFLFKSRASLTGYDSGGHAEIYLYDAGAGQLRCLSCNPTGAPASSDATLQSSEKVGWHAPWPENLRADGRRAFFETSEPLVARDSDGSEDVYEWEAQGVGSCSRPEGCIYLISSPQSREGEHLFAVSASGDDVFFLSSERLLGADADETASIYDARVGGGFAEPAQGACEGEGCRPQLAAPPPLPAGDTSARGARAKRHCAKGKRAVRRGGKVRCAKKRRHRHHRHHRATAGQKGARR
jgi:hypothetical protein